MMAPLKICIFTETYFPVVGGGETQARLLAEGLVRNGFSVIILTRRSDTALPKTEQFGEVTVYRLPPVGRGQLKKWGLLISSIPALINLRPHYDLVFVSGFRIVGVAAVLISKLFGKACVLKADSQGEMSGEFFRGGLARVGVTPGWWPFRLFLGVRNLILNRANAFTAITTDIAAELRETGVPPAAIRMIPNRVDTTLFCPVNAQRKRDLRGKLGLPPEGQIAVYTGRLVSYKGLPLLLRVWQTIRRRHPAAYLVLVGTGGLDIHNCEAEL
ncbi:MAG: glycosyltransferase family 4 protein, partial [Anaerolineae bacterium]|nr:glycosyltransferase family 4 protein [Anaerolineae bacterium]